MGSMGPTPRGVVSQGDINRLTELLAGTSAEIRTPSHPGYQDSIKRWSSAAVKPAGVAIVPTNASQVAQVVKYAAERDLDVAVKGGGHSTAGASSTDGGILFDLGKISHVDVDLEKKLLRVGGGANWGQVDEAAVKHSLATVGGTVADTGVGGLALGGGYGWLSGIHGLTVDCTVEIEVVLASGEIVKASESINPDLFWGMRGAGQNFGVATEFVFKAFEIPEKVWVGMVLFAPTPDTVEKVIAALNKLYTVDDHGRTNVNGKGMGGVGFAKPPEAGGNVMLLVPIIYLGTEAEGKAVFKGLLDIGPVANIMQMATWPEANKLLAPPYGLRSSMKGAAFELPIRADFVNKMVAEYSSFTNKCDDAAGSMILWELYDAVKVTQLSAGSFSNRGLHLNGLIAPIWTKPENDEICRQWARDLNSMFKKEMSEHATRDVGPGKEVTTLRGKNNATQFYGNYDHYDEKSKDIFGDNYSRLQKLKARYDPGNVFNKLFAITPA